MPWRGWYSRLQANGLHLAAANSGWLLFDKLARALLGLLVGAWVARYLGPAQFGVLAYVIAFIALFQAVANLSNDAIVVRDITQDRSAAPEILGTLLAMRVSAGVVCWAAVVASVAFFSPGDRQVLWMTVVVGGVLVFQAADSVDLWFQSQSQSRRTVVAKLSAYLVSSGMKVLLILANAPLEAFAFVTAFDALASAGGLWVAYRHMPTSSAWRRFAPRAHSLLAESWPFILSGVSIAAYSRVDQILVKQLLGDRSLGIYAAALPLAQFWQVIPVILATSLAPFIARFKQADEAGYRRALVLVFRAFFYLGVAIAMVTFAVSDLLVRLLFGAEFAEAAGVLNVLGIANVFCFLGIAHGLWLVNEKRFAVRLYGTLLASFVAVALNFALLPRVGIIGAAWAATAAQLVAAFLINLLLDRQSFRMQIEAIFFRKTQTRVEGNR